MAVAVESLGSAGVTHGVCVMTTQAAVLASPSFGSKPLKLLPLLAVLTHGQECM